MKEQETIESMPTATVLHAIALHEDVDRDEFERVMLEQAFPALDTSEEGEAPDRHILLSTGLLMSGLFGDQYTWLSELEYSIHHTPLPNWLTQRVERQAKDAEEKLAPFGTITSSTVYYHVDDWRARLGKAREQGEQAMNGHHMHGHGGPPAGDGHDSHGDGPDTHVMLVLGQEKVYLSHLPMFDHSQHAYQALLEVTLTQPGGDAQATYVNDRRAHPEVTLYTLVPDRFVLTDLVAAEPLRSFKAKGVFRGHFERPGHTLILRDVQVNVERVIHFRRFEPLNYLLFGNQGELLAAHYIVKAPDFDQVLSVRVSGQPFTDEELHGGVRLFVPGRANHITQRLRAGETVEGQVRAGGADHTRTIRLQVKAELYLEEGELDFPSTFDTTREERAAGL